MNLYRRLLCLLFGHRPAPLKVKHAGQPPTFKPFHVLVISVAEGLRPLCMNVCARCGEFARHAAQEIEWHENAQEQAVIALAEKQRQHAAEDKAKRDAAAKRQRGESIAAWKLRTNNGKS